MSPQAWKSLTPAVWQLRSAWISPAGRIVSACCSIQTRRISEREKLTVVPSKSSGSTSCGAALLHLMWLFGTGQPGQGDCVECVEIPQQLVGSGECCPCGLHSVISRLLAGGSLGFRIVHLLLPGSQIVVWHFVVCCFAFVLHCHTNP